MPQSRDSLLQRVEAASKLAADFAEESEKNRAIAVPVLDALRATGLLRAGVPADVGGVLPAVPTVLSAVESIASGDARGAGREHGLRVQALGDPTRRYPCRPCQRGRDTCNVRTGRRKCDLRTVAVATALPGRTYCDRTFPGQCPLVRATRQTPAGSAECYHPAMTTLHMMAWPSQRSACRADPYQLPGRTPAPSTSKRRRLETHPASASRRLCKGK
jgi:hypothetical protein